MSRNDIVYTPVGYHIVLFIIEQLMPDQTKPQQRGYSATKDQLIKRLKRIEGQVRGAQQMVEDERWCPDILVQLAAMNAALDSVALALVDGHVRHCVIQGPEAKQAERASELMAAVERLVRH